MAASSTSSESEVRNIMLNELLNGQFQTRLFHGQRPTLSDMSKLAYPGMIRTLEKKWGLPITGNLNDMLENYPTRHYTVNWSEYHLLDKAFQLATLDGYLDAVQEMFESNKSHFVNLICKTDFDLWSIARKGHFHVISYLKGMFDKHRDLIHHKYSQITVLDINSLFEELLTVSVAYNGDLDAVENVLENDPRFILYNEELNRFRKKYDDAVVRIDADFHDRRLNESELKYEGISLSDYTSKYTSIVPGSATETKMMSEIRDRRIALAKANLARKKQNVVIKISYGGFLHLAEHMVDMAIEGDQLDVIKYIVPRFSKNIYHFMTTAIKKGSLNALEYLSTIPIDEKNKSTYYENLLHTALQSGDPRIINFVLKFTKLKFHKDQIYNVVIGGNIKIVERFERQFGDKVKKLLLGKVSQLTLIRGRGNMDIIHHIIELGFDDWNSLLHVAVGDYNIPLARLAVENGAIDIKDAIVHANRDGALKMLSYLKSIPPI